MLDGRGGLTYSTGAELRTALETLRANPEKRRELGRLGFETYRANWTPDRHFEAYFALIAGLQNARARGEPAGVRRHA
jgi:hypothetical protein